LNGHSRRIRSMSSFIVIGLVLLSLFEVVNMFITPAFGADWWDTNWIYRKRITIDHARVLTDLTDFPIIVNFTDPDLAQKAQVDGDDIVFTDQAGTKLHHEIECFNSTSGHLTAWVDIPSLSSTIDTEIYIYYGNSNSGSQQNGEGVWDSNFMMVQHFNEKFEPHECRFWGMIANSLPEDVVLDHLVDLPNSLKNLGATNRDGWGIAYYNDTEPIVRRGEPPASEDPNFDLAAEEVASSEGRIGIGHVRRSASPPYNVPNPHPFKRFKNEGWWLFAHHGTIDKYLLVNLIGDEYLAANPPEIGGNIDEWNDSELYFIYLLKCMDESSWNVTAGVARAVTAICDVNPNYNMNFVLSNGEVLWAFRRGDAQHMLYYYYNSASPQYSAVASQYPTSSQGDWVALDNYNFIELTRTAPPTIVEDIREHTPTDHFDSTINDNDGVAHGGVDLYVDGKIDGADRFDGVDDYIRIADDSTLDGDGSWSEMTVEFWVKSTSDNQRATIILAKRDTSSYGSYQIGFDSAGSSQIFWGLYLSSGYGETNYADTPSLMTNQWYHVVGTFDSPTIKLYINGVLEATGSKSGLIAATDGTPIRLGCRGSGSGTERHLEGGLDEVRISNIARSPAWISTSFNNEHDTSSFYSIGSEEAGLQAPVISDEEPSNMETRVSISLSQLSFRLTDYQEDQMNYTIASSPDIGSDSATNVGDGTYTLSVSNLNYSTTYTWQVNVTDGTHWTNITYSFTTVSSENTNLVVDSIMVDNQGCSFYANDTYVNGTPYYIPVQVTVENVGDNPAGQFNVSLENYWTSGGQAENLLKLTVSDLDVGENVTLTFGWRPTHTRHYNLTATVDCEDDVEEDNEDDNNLSKPNLPVTVTGDVNSDGTVNIFDAVVTGLAWGSNPGSVNWDTRADINHDSQVNILDAVRIGLHWSETW